MSEKIIKTETKQGEGIYLIEVDKEKSSKVEGSNHVERINNAIKDFLSGSDSERQVAIGYKIGGSRK
jgi:hypothetical protein